MAAVGADFPEDGQARMVALEIAATPESYREILAGWLGDPPDADGLSALRASFWIDYGFVAGYVLLLVSCLRIVRGDLPRWVYGVPIVVGVLDGVENAFHLLVLGTVTGGQPLPDVFFVRSLAIASIASHAKWILFGVVSILILILYLRNLRRIPRWPCVWIGVALIALLAFDLVYLNELLSP
jgi:hypothetical protein